VFFFIFSLVYIGFLSDLIINNILTIGDLFGFLEFGLVKTSAFYLIYLIIVTKQSYKILKGANISYLENIGVLDELTQAVLLKIKILRWNLVIVISYVIVFICGNFGIAFYNYKSNLLYSDMFNVILDIITLICLLINLKPRKLLFLYESVNFEFEEFDSILKVKIKKKKLVNLIKSIDKTTSVKTDLLISKYLSKNDKNRMIKEYNHFVIMIVNPSTEFYYSNSTLKNSLSLNETSSMIINKNAYTEINSSDKDLSYEKSTANSFACTVLSSCTVGTIEYFESK
jgi:hypothetical protein